MYNRGSQKSTLLKVIESLKENFQKRDHGYIALYEKSGFLQLRKGNRCIELDMVSHRGYFFPHSGLNMDLPHPLTLQKSLICITQDLKKHTVKGYKVPKQNFQKRDQEYIASCWEIRIPSSKNGEQVYRARRLAIYRREIAIISKGP